MDDSSFYIEKSTIFEKTEEDNIRKPGIFEVSILYSLSVVLLFFIGSRFQRLEFNSGILITEFILILLPPLILLRLGKYDLKKVLRINKISGLNALIIFGIMLFAPFVVNILNMPYLMLINKIFGRVDIKQPPIADGFVGIILSVLLIAGSAGICEEVLFRGTLQRGFEKFGPYKSIVITAFLFGLMHADFQKLFGIFLLGILIGFIVYRTNSIFGGMIAHFANNALAVIMQFVAVKLLDFVKKSGIQDVNDQAANSDINAIFNMPLQKMLMYMIGLGFWLAVLGTLMGLLIFALVRNTKKDVKKVAKEKNTLYRVGLVALTPGIALVGFVYFAVGARLLNVKITLVDEILKIIGIG